MSRFDFSSQQDRGNNTGGGDRLPSRLTAHDQWLVTQDKKPVAPSNGWPKPANHLAFTEAQTKAEQVGGELAFCFTDSGPFIGFDLDDVTVDGAFTDEARGIVQGLDSYTEVSSSGTGLHIIAEGKRAGDRKTRADLSEGGHLEVYDTNRYFVLTSNVYDNQTSVQDRQIATQAVQVAYLPPQQSVATTGQQKSVNEQKLNGGHVDATPEQVWRTIRAYAKSDSHDVDEEVLRLWQGVTKGESLHQRRIWPS